MVAPETGDVVLILFPFSDLSDAKLRPAVVLADAGRGDWVLCQVTSNAYSDPRAVEIQAKDFISGGLSRESYARPGRLFTANQSLIDSIAGELTDDALDRIIDGVIDLLNP